MKKLLFMSILIISIMPKNIAALENVFSSAPLQNYDNISIFFSNVASIINYENICENSSISGTVVILGYILEIAKWLAPLILIVLGMIDYGKASILSDDNAIKSATTTFIRRFIAAITIFFIVTIVDVFADIVLETDIKKGNFASCTDCLMDPVECSKKVEEYKKRENEIIKQNQINNNINKYNYITINNSTIISNYDQNTNNDGTFLGKTYNLTDNELNFFTSVATCEQGTETGIAAEASLMANLYELKGKNYSSLYNYVKNSGWFSCSKKSTLTSYSHKIKPEAKSKVKSVLVLGNRTLPLYIDEHDCINCYGTCSNGNKGDICKIKNNNQMITSMKVIKNRSNYIKNNTVLYNRYGSVYTFYTFPCSTCDPFGYTSSAKATFDKWNNS